MTIPTTTLDAIRGLQEHVGAGNRARGFREDEELLDQQTEAVAFAIEHFEGDEITFSREFVEGLLGTLKNAKIHGQANRLLLMVSEIVEAHDEIRSGREATETYYVYAGESGGYEAPRIDPLGKPRKPEGVPSEIADTFIRTLDFADAAEIDLAAIIEEKDAYNATRPYKHGRRF